MASKKTDDRPVVLMIVGNCDPIALKRAALEHAPNAAESILASASPNYGARPSDMDDRAWSDHKHEKRTLVEAADEPYISHAEDLCFSEEFRVVVVVASGCFPARDKGFPMVANPDRWYSVVSDFYDRQARDGHKVIEVRAAYRA